MSQSIQVRLATPDDSDFAFDEPQIAEAVRQRQIAEGDVWVAEAGGARVGFLRIERIWSKIPFIALIRVQPDCRRRGVGAALLGHVEAELRGQGHRVLYSSSEAHAAEAQAWHHRRGFEECGFIAGINSGGIGEIFFRKQL